MVNFIRAIFLKLITDKGINTNLDGDYLRIGIINTVQAISILCIKDGDYLRIGIINTAINLASLTYMDGDYLRIGIINTLPNFSKIALL